MVTDGQKWALDQLKEIAQKSNDALELLDVVQPIEEGGDLEATVSVECSCYARVGGGIPFRARERLSIFIPSQFPLEIPILHFVHSDYAKYPHVQWGSHICLYQSSETEWQPHDGMFGYIQRINEWLKAAAAGQLDPIGLPLHPPAVYRRGKYLAVVPTQNTPIPDPPWWAGYAKITRENDVCVELGEWLEHGGVPFKTRVASAILLPGDMPFEYPSTISALKNVLADRGIPLDIIRLLLTMGALRNPDEKPLVFILGAAMRGIAGGERRQHLAAWYIKPEQAQELREAALAATEENPIDEQLFNEWAERARIDWCDILEDRPEIVVQRDTGTPAAYWRGRHVAILGCGAIGSTLAMLLTRAGATKLQLYDHAAVKPGLIVRQHFDRRQIGYTKSSATRVNVLAINPNINATSHHGSILEVLRDEKKAKSLFEADVVINATASIRVASALEHHLQKWPKIHPPIISMAVGHRADAGLMTMATQAVPGVTSDLDRRLKLEFANASSGRHFLDEFWPAKGQTNRLFQPEPGCSDPTFAGSATDMAVLVGRMLNVASGWLSSGSVDRSYGFGVHVPTSPQTTATIPSEAEFAWTADTVFPDLRRGYQIRLAGGAISALLTWMRKSERLNGASVETGGVLFGQIDDLLKIIWITEVSGPPPDSVQTRDGFVCGTIGVEQMNAEKVARSRDSVAFIGMWHTHPGAAPVPSAIDRGAMENLLGSPDFHGRQFVMLIVGHSSAEPLIGGALFDRDE